MNLPEEITHEEHAQFVQLKRFCELWIDDPNAGPPAFVGAAKYILGIEQDQQQEQDQTSEEEEEESESESEPEPPAMTLQQHRKLMKSDISERYALVGKDAPNHMHLRVRHLIGNPYKIPIDKYVECPRCEKVGVSTMKIDVKRSGITNVYQKIRHPGHSDHWVRVDTFDEKLTWQEVFERKTKSHKNRSLDMYRYPKKEQIMEVEEDESGNEIEVGAEVTA